ncbi:putative tail fiber protein of phage [Salmonella enterica subsp. enterica serovar Weltevreden str. 2007-60-3289-1]|nr:putative tail fiber protein of phage [Salmonella enterica subsp. enterica serovar Weltevreden str. 2007-60-3289-1]
MPDTDENRRADIHAAGSLKTVKSFKGFIRRKSCAGRQNRKRKNCSKKPKPLLRHWRVQ